MSDDDLLQIDSSTLKIDEEEETAPTSRFQSIYKKEAKPMDLNFLRGIS